MSGIRLRDRLRYAVREDTLNFALRTLIVIAYIVGLVLTTRYSERCAALAETPLTAPILYLFLTNIRTAFALAGGSGGRGKGGGCLLHGRNSFRRLRVQASNVFHKGGNVERGGRAT